MSSVAAFFTDGRDERARAVAVWFSPNRSGGLSLWKRRNGRWRRSKVMTLEEIAAYMNGYAGDAKAYMKRKPS